MPIYHIEILGNYQVVRMDNVIQLLLIEQAVFLALCNIVLMRGCKKIYELIKQGIRI